MSKKLNNDIFDDFRKKMNLEKKDLSKFLDVFQSVFEEALLRDKIVKISGLGTFKLIEVESRKSVDVNTGEEIEIAGHYKLNFIPESAVKKLVNEPLAHLETIELDDVEVKSEEVVNENEDADVLENGDVDPLQKLTEQALELKDILSDINSIDEKFTSNTENNEIYPLESESPIDTGMQKTSCDVSVVESDENLSENMYVRTTDTVAKEDADNEVRNLEDKSGTMNVLLQSNDKNQTVQTKDKISEEESKRKKEQELLSAKAIIDSINNENSKTKSNATLAWVVVAIFLFVTILGLIFYQNLEFFSYRNISDTNSIFDNLVEDIDSTTGLDAVDVSFVDTAVCADVDTDVSSAFVSEVDTTSMIYCADFSDIFNCKRAYSEFIDTVALNEGSRLTWVSLNQYGHKDFWVFIYEANRDIIGDPNCIKVGTEVRIPRIDPKLIDASNPECIKYARYLHDLYVRKHKN